MFWRRLLAAVWIVLGAGIPALGLSAPGAAAQGGTDSAPADPWWQDAVFTEVFVRSYLDSDGDGSGDLRGLTELLDYLNDGSKTTNRDLGVTALWLMPVAEAASYHGYDVLDYTTIESDYGTNDDFRAFVDAALARGLRVFVDLVLNHTSDGHPWFVDSASDPASPYRGWYVWVDAVPDGEQTLLVALNFGADDVSGCALSLEAGPLSAGTYAARDILNGPTLASLTVDTAGDFDACLPVDPLPARQDLIAVLDARPEAAAQ